MVIDKVKIGLNEESLTALKRFSEVAELAIESFIRFGKILEELAAAQQANGADAESKALSNQEESIS